MLLPLKLINYIVPMLATAILLLLLLLFSHYLDLPSLSSPVPISTSARPSGPKAAFTDLVAAFELWDAEVGCAWFREKHAGWAINASAIRADDGDECAAARMSHVSVLVKGWTWIPDSMDDLYPCRCGMTCLWTKSPVLADNPDAVLFESVTPPATVTRVAQIL